VVKTAKQINAWKGAATGWDSILAHVGEVTESTDFVRQALLHNNDDLRLSALEMVCASLRTTAMPSAEDLNLIIETLGLTLKSVAMEHKQQVRVKVRDRVRVSHGRAQAADKRCVAYKRTVI